MRNSKSPRFCNSNPHIIMLLSFALMTSLPLSLAHAQSIKDLFEQAAQFFYDGKYDQAISNYEKVIELDPNFAPAYNALGLALKVNGAQTDEAAFYFKKALEIDPKFVASYDNLGKLYYSSGNIDEAESYFSKGLELDGGNESMLLSMGWVNLLGRNSPDKAMKYFKAVVQKSGAAMGYFGQGICFMSNNKRMEVVDIVTKLRTMGQESLAKDLEAMLRENRTLVKGPEMPQANALVTAPKNEAPVSPNAHSQNNSSNSSAATPNGWQEYNDNGEFQVRLRGKLNE